MKDFLGKENCIGLVKPDDSINWHDWFTGLHAAIAATRHLRRTDIKSRLLYARQFIDQNYHQPIDLDKVAKIACFSRYHFLRLFRQYFGITPHQYLMEKRIEQAKELLLSTERSVTEICFSVGFQSLGSFSNLFRRQVGYAPGRYRSKIFQSLWNPPEIIPWCFFSAYRQP